MSEKFNKKKPKSPRRGRRPGRHGQSVPDEPLERPDGSKEDPSPLHHPELNEWELLHEDDQDDQRDDESAERDSGGCA